MKTNRLSSNVIPMRAKLDYIDVTMPVAQQIMVLFNGQIVGFAQMAKLGENGCVACYVQDFPDKNDYSIGIFWGRVVFVSIDETTREAYKNTPVFDPISFMKEQQELRQKESSPDEAYTVPFASYFQEQN